jgi:outer membrane protein assembly factor BamB
MSMAVRRIRASIVLTVAGAVLALTACGTVPAARAGSATTSAPATAPTTGPARGTPAGGSCGPPPPRYAWAVEVSTAGRMLWKTPLATRNAEVSPDVPPLLAGSVAVFAQDGIVHGLDIASGHPLWSWTGRQWIDGMWRWGGLVAVLTAQTSGPEQLTGLDAATGAVRWVLPVPGRGLLGSQAPTADGGLAMVTTAGVLQVVNLADGHVRWRRHTGASPTPVAAGGLVILGVNERLTGYDDRTGQPRWTTTGVLSPGPVAQLTGGLVLLGSDEQGPGIPTTLTAVIPSTGQIAWRFDPGEPLTVLSAGPAGLIVAAYVPSRRLYLLDPRTGRPRWQAGTFVTQGALPLITRTAVITAEGLQTSRIVDRDAADGRVRWQGAPIAALISGQPVTQAGPLAVVQSTPGRPGTPAPLLAYQLTSGRLAWQADMPTFVQASPVLVPGGILVQPADLIYACAVAG